MKILFITNSCSIEKYEYVRSIRRVPLIDPQQKFFNLMISGISKCADVEISVISVLPVSASSVKKKVFFAENEKNKEGVMYYYLPFINGKFLRYIMLLISSRSIVKKWIKKNCDQKCIVIFDSLIFISRSVHSIARKNSLFSVGVVTDLPLLSTNMKDRDGLIKRFFYRRFQRYATKDIKEYDALIPLTESINKEINPYKKPYLIVEGFADSNDTKIEDNHGDYIMYAGGLYKKYGLDTLVKAFIELRRNDIELWLFGEGAYIEDILSISKKHSNIKYKGCVSPKEVVSYEKKALLLVNPRPTEETFAKYSFPSKTMEYLLSGTATISTKLPGIPEEYFQYMYSFEGCDVSSIKKGLEYVLSFSREDLRLKGKMAHDFVINSKNNKYIGKKIFDFIKYCI